MLVMTRHSDSQGRQSNMSLLLEKFSCLYLEAVIGYGISLLVFYG